jgi:hypothetical protein
MQTQEVTMYTVSGSVGDASQQDNLNIQLTSSSGITDGAVLALAKAIQGVVWPAGITCSVYVSKIDQTSVVSSGSLAATPPAFI